MPGHDPGRRVLLALVGVLVLSLGWVASARPALAADQTLELEVVINGASTQKVGEFVLRDGALLATREELSDLGLRAPEDAARSADGLIAVSSLRGVSVSLDQAAQVVRFAAGSAELTPTLLHAGPGADGPPLQSSFGATLNYDVVGAINGGQASASGLFDARVFSPMGVASTDFLAFAGQDPGGRSGAPAIRLDSTYVYSDFPRQRRYRLGDFISGGLTWTRPVRLGGLQVSQDFSMRPDLVTFPLPSLSGAAAVPSTVDVLLNGSKVLSSQVPAGPFQAPQLPVVTGSGEVVMSVTDALGRQVTTTLPFYASASLLAPGLQTASLEVGFVRRNWGVFSNDYGAPAGSVTWRRGFTSHLTVEAHAEGTSGQLMAGAGVVANAFDLGTVNVAIAASRAAGRTGASISFGAERQTHRLSFGIQAVLSERDFRDLAAMNGDTVLKRQVSANVGLNLGRWGSIGLAYAQIDRPAAAPLGQVVAVSPGRALAGAQHTQVATGNYSVQLGRAYIYANVFKDFARGGGRGATIGVTLPLGRRSSVTASVNPAAAPYAQVQVQQSVSSIGDWGYQAFVGAGGREHAFAQGQYKSPFALLTAGADYLGGEGSGRVEAQGAVSLIDRRLFASNTIEDSFAVVDTAGVKGVRVEYENRPVGRTDSGGRILVPDLRAFDVNRLSIDPTDLPLDVAIPETSREVRPPDRSGVVVVFPVRRIRAALVSLVDEAGAAIPVGSTAVLKPGGLPAPVGYEGQVFVEGLGPQNRLEVQSPSGDRCVVAFPFQPVKDDVPKIGPLVCRRAAA